MEQKPTIITFNYDVFIETAIEVASGENPSHENKRKIQKDLTEQAINNLSKKSKWKWDRTLGYGVEFDDIELHNGSVLDNKTYISKSNFYKNNPLYSWQILKLHGSINWYKYVKQSPNRWINNKEEEFNKRFKEIQNKIVLRNLDWYLPYTLTPYDNTQFFVEPLIVTPVLYKEIDRNEAYEKVFEPLWKKAKEELTSCQRIIIIGYSFPSSDFYIKKLLLESLSDKVLDELIMVNPDKNVINEIDFIRYKKMKTYDNLEEYMCDNFVA